MKKKFLNFQVSEELDKKTFEMAHKLRMSKSEYIRQAIKEKNER